ncbi:MAG: nucleoside-diphosphate sugar epimerase/dehydratase [bacterium]|nr:nucleoside-diphosphate sugar epimerase/dehydratase [bacterium]
MADLTKKLGPLFAKAPRKLKRWIFRALDALLFLTSIFISYSLRFDFSVAWQTLLDYGHLIALVIAIKVAVFNFSGMYKTILRYAGAEMLNLSFRATLASSGLIIFLAFLTRFSAYPNLPRSIMVLDAVLSFILVVYIRVFLRWFLYQVNNYGVHGKIPEKVILYGAGQAGSQIYQAMRNITEYRVVAFVDDNPALQRQLIHGLTVYPPAKMSKLIERHEVKSIVLAMPSASRKEKLRIMHFLQQFNLPINTIPGIADLVSGKLEVNQIRKVDIVDLLGRKEVLPQPELLWQNIKGKTVMVTGAGGSIGSELCRQIAQQNPKRLILLERNELALYNIDAEFQEGFPDANHVSCLGSVLDERRMREVLTKYNVETLYHAAAYKHVPLVEDNPSQGILNNVLGTFKTAQLAQECGLESFVLISTDKAVRPTNIMGATKRIAELVCQALAQRPNQKTRFVMVRFGNVLDSAGSVVPRFRKQIAAGGPLTVTHKEITRYFMSIPEAVRLVIQAGAMGQGGEVFVLDMGDPVKIYDLAKQMIELSGLQLDQDIEIQFTGLRPGEKLYEELLIDAGNTRQTQHPKIFSAHEKMIPDNELRPLLDQLFDAAEQNNLLGMLTLLQKLVPEYSSRLLAKDLVAEETESSDKVIKMNPSKTHKIH